MGFTRRWTFVCTLVFVTAALFYLWSGTDGSAHGWPGQGWQNAETDNYFWKSIGADHPPESIRPLPTSAPIDYPKIQAVLSAESTAARNTRQDRQRAVKETFAKCWASYREHAWTSDELKPVSGGRNDPFGGWAATLVDSLDTLWIMGMRREFKEAVKDAAAIDFTKTNLHQVNVFETNIRYLGGFLAAFDLSHDIRLLRKAAEVGEMLYKALDTPNRMPVTRWDLHAALDGKKQVAPASVLLAEIGSLSLEFTRLSQLTGDPKWFDAAQRITDDMAAQQDSTLLPGLWAVSVKAHMRDYTNGTSFSFGAMADSAYEYLPKMSALMGGQLPVYQSMYEKAVDAAVEHLLFRPMTTDGGDILLSGVVDVNVTTGKTVIQHHPQAQHLVCFLGGLLALGGKLFRRAQDVATAAKLTEGCIWAYNTFPLGIMPETFHAVPCKSRDHCPWDEAKWKQAIFDRSKEKDDNTVTVESLISKNRFPPGITAIPDRRYLLRPEAIESIFVLYRTTGHFAFAESAWAMFTSIRKTTSTKLANSAVEDVTISKDEPPQHLDSMESFWLGETLKYFYLVFSEPDLISLDDFVFNTEAHPFRRLVK